VVEVASSKTQASSLTPLPPSFARCCELRMVPLPRFAGQERKFVLAARCLRPSFCQAIPTTSTTKIRSCRGQGSGAPKGALSYQYPRLARLRANDSRAHLSALTLAALATGYYPDGSAPEPGFPRRPLTGVSPASPTKRTDMPRLSTLRADRSLCRSTGDPKPPGSGLAKKSARGHRTSHSPFRHAVRNGALHKARCISCNRKRDEVSRKK
jgi:hypothetical protein